MKRIAKLCGVWIVGLVAILGQVEKVSAVSPLDPDPFLLKAAPEKCIAFFHNFGSKPSDADSKNRTEQFFADPEVRQFMKEMDRLILAGIDSIDAESQDSEMSSEDARLAYFWIKQFFTKPYSAYFSKIEFDESDEPNDIDAGIVFKPGDQLPAAKEMLQRLISSVPDDRVVSTDILGVTCTELKPESNDENEPSVFIAEHGDYLLLTIGNQSMHGVLSRTKKGTPPNWLRDVVRRLRIPRTSFLFHVDFSEINRLLEMVDDPQFPVIWSELGFHDLTKIGVVSGLNDEGSLVRGVLKASRLSGIFQLFDGAPLTAGDFSHIPAKVNSATAVRFSLAKLLDVVRSIAGKIDPAEAAKIDQGLGMFQAMTNIDIENDLLAPLGDTWTVYQTGVSWMGLPQLTATVSTTDANKLRTTLDRFMVLVKAQLMQANQGTEIAESEIAGNKVYYLRGLPIAPAWTVSESQLVIGSSSNVLKSHLTRPAQKSVAETAVIARRLNAKRKPIVLNYSDMKTTVQRVFASLPMLTNMASAELAKRNIEFDPSVVPAWETISPYIGPSVMSLHRGENELEFLAEESLPISSLATVGTPTFIVLTLPAINAARTAARRAQSINYAKQIVLAVHNYESTNRHFPAAASKAANGKPGLSWRVHILPFLDEQTLYNEFRLDEPWDSEHNKALIKKIPDAYRSPASSAELGKTNFLAVGGPDALISGVDKGTRVGEARDGLSNTIMVVEVNDERAVEWTKPGDFVWKEDKPAEGLGGLYPGGFVVALGDGSVRFINHDIKPQVLAAMFTKSKGESVEPEDFE